VYRTAFSRDQIDRQEKENCLSGQERDALTKPFESKPFGYPSMDE
jgi:hypothetical protein